jgi:DeoR family transcriptional regulator of aga operon
MDETPPLGASERRMRIAELVAERDQVRVATLAREFGLTDTSIRRDLAILEREQRLIRVHGGAVALPKDPRAESLHMKSLVHLNEKRRIGAAASKLIHEGDAILLDSGTTTIQVAAHIPDHLRAANKLTFVTNSLPLVEEVRTWPSATLVLLGGIYLADYHAIVGPQAIAQLSEIAADMVFLGAEGLTIEGGVSTANILMAEVDRAMVERSRRVIIATDSSKLGRSGLTSIVSLAQIDILITDSNAPEELVEAIRAKGVEVWLV